MLKRASRGRTLCRTSFAGSSAIRCSSYVPQSCLLSTQSFSILAATRSSLQNSRSFASSTTTSSAPTSPVLLETDNDGVATLTLNNPRERNALSLATLKELDSQLDNIKKDSSIRVVILKAEGPVFSSGHNLKELKGKDKPFYEDTFHIMTGILEKVRHLEKPVIAQVDGLATAAGAQLVAGCDLVLATKKSSFALPGVKVGLFCSTPAVAVARSITSTKKTMEMLLTGDALSADEAYTFGLVNRVVETKEELDTKTKEMAKKIASYSSTVIGLGKKAFYQQIAERDPSAAYGIAEKVMSNNACLYDAQEGMSAFLEKRHPNWKKE